MSTAGAPRKASSVAQFKRKNDPIELPSGNYIVIKKTSIAGFLQGGNIPNGLMPMLQGALAKRQMIDSLKDEDEAIAEILSDPTKISEMFGAVDAYVCAVALDPRVYPVPGDDEERDDSKLYVDEMEEPDRMFIFQKAMGSTDDVASFRTEFTTAVEPVQPSEVKPVPTKRAARPRKKV